jgi:hypothetical protein
MSRFTYSRIESYTVRDVARFNQFFTDLLTADALTSANYAEEGLDASAFVGDSCANELKSVIETTRAALAPSATFITYNPNGTNLRTSAIGAVATAQALRITSLAYFESQATNQPGLPRATRLEMQHAWNNGSSTTVIACSRAKERAGVLALNQDSREHRTVAIESWLFGPIANVAWVEVQYKLEAGAGDAYPSKSMLLVDAFYGVKVL